MENQLQIFEHEKFGEIRVIIIDGKLWFVAADICRALEVGNTSQALKRLEDDEKMTLSLNDSHSGKRGGAQFMTLINEPGFYRLVFSSRKKVALDFQRWVYHEVLPSINATGSYSLPSAETAPVPAETVKKTRRQLSAIACVYIILLSNGLIKIGHTGNICRRIAEIKRQTNSTVKDVYHTFFISREIACRIEKICQEKYSSFRAEGEFFTCTFDELCQAIDSFIKVEVERNKALLEVAGMMNSSPEKQAILISVANFYVGKILV